MNVYIQTDIEGVAGVTFFDRHDDTISNYNHRLRMRKLLTHEVNAAVKAAFDSGAEVVLVNDSHGNAYNILFEELDPRCEILHGRANTQPFWLQDIDDGFDIMVLVGMHAMAGTEGANLPHSKWILNDGELYLSEASMAAAIAGYYGVKTVFVSGDNYITQEVASKIPGIVIGVVKKALGPYFARSKTPQAAQKIIYDGVCKGIKNQKEIKPYVLKPPYRLNLLDSEYHMPPFKKVLEKDVEGDDLVDVFKRTLDSFPWNKFGLMHVDGFHYLGT
ncbi:MAG: M55 family metallopeptidase [Caldicoprobacterales bacterium]